MSSPERRELKFVFEGADPDALRDVLAVNAAPVAFGDGPVSWVNSIYFDDHRLSSCSESMQGIARRVKLRVRWYDEPLASGLLHFEIKRRRGLWIRKDRTPVELDLPLEALGYPGLAEVLGKHLDDAGRDWLSLRPHPTLLVSYRREHFVDPGGGVRLTLDYDVECASQLGARRPERGWLTRLEGIVIIEVKTEEASAADVRRLLHPLRARLSRCSKYRLGCEVEGLCSAHGLYV